jgi:hypothetical protein
MSRKQLATVKRAAKHMRLGWQAEAARPESAFRLCDAIERLGLEDGCEEWGRQNRDAARDDKPKTERIRDGIKALLN